MNATSDGAADRLTAAEVVPPGFGITDPDGRILGDIQGNILRGYNMRFVRHIVVRVADARAARAFIGAVVSGEAAAVSLTTAAQWERESKPKTCLNIGITAEGLVALGLDDRSMRTFPEEFRQGPAKRAKKIGDVDGSAPEHWRFGFADPDNVHVVWTIHADADRADLDSVTDDIESIWKQTGAFTVTSHIDGATFDTYDGQHRDARATVHFGYRDSISQPRFAVNGARIGAPDAQPLAPVGAVLIGPDYTTTFPDVLWQIPRAYRGSVEFPIATNGCYNAFRVLEQDVYAFEEFLEESSAAINTELERRRTTNGITAAAGQAPTEESQIIWDKERVAAKLLGRWRNGVPMHRSDATLGPFLGSGMPPLLPDAALNNFDYPDPDPRFHDYDGRQCPMGAHVRRANPRGSQIVQRSANHTRLLVRRGIPYGPPFDPTTGNDRVARGLLGNFLCASLIAQFEAIMYDWVNLGLQDPRITGTNDPIIGANQVRTSRFEIPTAMGDTFGEPLVLRGFPRFTETVGSAYLFCPSITSLRFLADPDGPIPQRPSYANGARLAAPGIEPAVTACAP